MSRKLIYSLPCLLLAACADTSDKYRDIQHLEMPPTLAIEHTNTGPVEIDSEVTPRKNSLLDGIESLIEKDGKPIMQINTRLDRAWDLTETALKLASIEVVDKNRNELTIQVNYDPDGGGLMSLLTSQYDEASYTLTLTEAVTGIEVGAKLSEKNSFGESQEGYDDASAELIKHLHRVLQEKVINRENKDNGDS